MYVGARSGRRDACMTSGMSGTRISKLLLNVCVLVGCVGDEPVATPTPKDSGPAPIEASTGIDAGAMDSGSDAVMATDASDAASPACDVNKPFGRPSAILTDDTIPVPLEVYHFRVAKNATRAYYLKAGTAGLIGADLTTDRKLIPGAPGLPLTVLGFGISEDETQLVVAAGGPALTVFSRANASVPFENNAASKSTYTFVPPVVPNATVNDIYTPYFKKGGGIAFALNQRDNAGSVASLWDVYEGTLGGTAITAFPVAGLQLPSTAYNFSPVPSTTTRMFITRWGNADAPGIDRTRSYEATRTGAGPWDPPRLMTFPSVPPDAGPPPLGEAMITFDISPDQCEIFFGRGAILLGTYQVFHARRPL
jgi:hypothetical protein